MITVHEYSLPFKRAFRSASDHYTRRDGLIFTYAHPQFGSFSAEAAPLPGFSPENLSNLKDRSHTILRDFHSMLTSHTDPAEIQSFLKKIDSLPSLQFALSFIGLFHLSGMNKCPNWFSSPFASKKKPLINDVIGISDEEEFHQAMSDSLGRGYRTIKIKCPYPFGYLPDLLRHYSKEYPDLRIRLDANQSWPERALAKFPLAFDDVRVEYIEEPCTDLRSVADRYPDVPVAFDESIIGLDDLKKVLSEFPDRYIIIKPALFGNIFALAETILRYRGLRNRIVFSTLLESAVGRSLILLLATTLGDYDLAHGINTGKFFVKDLLQSGESFSEPSSASFFPKHSIQYIPDNEHIKTLFTIY